MLSTLGNKKMFSLLSLLFIWIYNRSGGFFFVENEGYPSPKKFFTMENSNYSIYMPIFIFIYKTTEVF